MRAAALVILFCCSGVATAGEYDIEYVSEHLVEVAMAHRYAALPVWPRQTGEAWEFTAQAGYSLTQTGELELAGPTLSFAVHRALRPGLTLSGFVFFDDLSFSGRDDHRPLNVTFADDVPLSLPADAVFTELGGSSRSSGLGLSLSHAMTDGWLAGWRWNVGVLWQQLELRDYSSPFVLLSGPSEGATGIIDYSLSTSFTTPFAGISRPIVLGRWTLEPRFLVAAPLPRRGVQGRIIGDGFDISGNSADTGHSKNYGDPSPVLGMTVRYDPWGLEIDFGTLLTEALLEPQFHAGTDSNYAISAAWHF